MASCAAGETIQEIEPFSYDTTGGVTYASERQVECLSCDGSCASCEIGVIDANHCLSCPSGKYLEVLDLNSNTGRCDDIVETTTISNTYYVTGNHDGVTAETGDKATPFSNLFKAVQTVESLMSRFDPPAGSNSTGEVTILLLNEDHYLLLPDLDSIPLTYFSNYKRHDYKLTIQPYYCGGGESEAIDKCFADPAATALVVNKIGDMF